MSTWPTPPDPLDRPCFITTDPAALLAGVLAGFEAQTGKTLHPAQPERLLANAVAYVLSVHAQRVQDALEQGLADFARAPMLDFLGRNIGVTRLPPQPARCSVRATRIASGDAPENAPPPAPLLLPAGLALTAGPDGPVFRLAADLWLPADSSAAEGTALADDAGTGGNGFAAGQLVPLAPLPPGISLTSSSPTGGGSALESDDDLRLRILAAPEAFSVAGPTGAYEFHARSVSPVIIDAAASSPLPGDVVVTVLTAGGMPSADLLAAVQAALRQDTIRPLCDAVTVAAPQRVPFSLAARITLLAAADGGQTLARTEAAALAWAADRRAGLGRNLIGSQVMAALHGPGVHQVELPGWSDRLLARHEWADCTGVTITLAGRADD